MSQLYVKSDNDYSEKISKKSKILNMPKMAQNCPKWPKILNHFQSSQHQIAKDDQTKFKPQN